MPEQIDFRFRCQLSAQSPHGLLARYLRSKEADFPMDKMILWATSAFWYPLACKWAGGRNEADLKQKARNAIYQLQQQMVYLAQTFDLDLELEPRSLAPSVSVSSSPWPQVSEPAISKLELTPYQDDALLDEAFR